MQYSTLVVRMTAIVATVVLFGCGGPSNGSEDTHPALDAMLDRDPSAMSDSMMMEGGWQGSYTIGGVDYRVFETLVDGEAVRLFYKPVGSQQGLELYMYDIEPFQLGD